MKLVMNALTQVISKVLIEDFLLMFEQGPSSTCEVKFVGKSSQGKFLLFNDTSRAHWLLNVKHMVIVTYFFRRNPLSLHRLLFLISSKGYMHFPIDRRAHIIAFEGPVLDYWLEKKRAQTANAPIMQVQSDDPNL